MIKMGDTLVLVLKMLFLSGTCLGIRRLLKVFTSVVYFELNVELISL